MNKEFYRKVFKGLRLLVAYIIVAFAIAFVCGFIVGITNSDIDGAMPLIQVLSWVGSLVVVIALRKKI